MYTIDFYIEKIQDIPFDKFCESLLESEDKKCILGWLGVQDCNISKWYNINNVKEARDLNYLFVKYLYPILESKGIRYNTLLLEQGKIIFGINDNDIKICLALNITHKTIKGRLLQALDKINEIILSSELLELAMDSEEAEYEIIG
jgi:hypothetical protein